LRRCVVGDIMTADEARRRMGWDLADAIQRVARAEARADAAEAERDALRAQLVALANEASKRAQNDDFNFADIIIRLVALAGGGEDG